jgi:hypothetical protein
MVKKLILKGDFEIIFGCCSATIVGLPSRYGNHRNVQEGKKAAILA